jgi:hypothetical protein
MKNYQALSLLWLITANSKQLDNSSYHAQTHSIILLNISYPYHLLLALLGINFAVLGIFLIHQVKIAVHHVGSHIEDLQILK